MFSIKPVPGGFFHDLMTGEITRAIPMSEFWNEGASRW